jgi:protein-S-isoprenylcysteine O-methyltransferase Ste14
MTDTKSPFSQMPKPLFELKGPFSRIDLSAWVAGLSFLVGFFVAGSRALARDIAGGGYGLMTIAAAFVVFLISVLIIQRHMRFKFTSSTFGEPQHLVTDGIFKYSRNPIYVAVLLPLLFMAMLSVLAAVVAVVFYIIVMNYTVIRKEERDLAQAFGQPFHDYMKTAPRWIF